MNKPEQAVEWFDFASGDGFPCYPLFASDKNLATLRKDAGFVEFMQKLKQQWADYASMF